MSNENVGIALALVVGAGASTGLGAAVVFFPSIVKLASRRVLAGSLGFSAGVMSYVSFVEIFGKAVSHFEDAGHAEDKVYVYSTLSFFGGVFLMMILNTVVSCLLGDHGHRQEPDGHKGKSTRKDVKTKDKDAFTPPCCSNDPVGQLDNFQRMASVLDHEKEATGEGGEPEQQDGVEEDDDFVENLPLDTTELEGDNSENNNDSEDDSEENQRLVRMGINTALAIGLHNFPEGLATFVAALDDPRVGSVLAVAIAIHNVPEGLCVALPIFYATGNRLRAFLWALLSGASEFVAALLGWAILANRFTDNAYALLFGLVSGMMVIISIRELLPTAHFYDPADTVVTNSFVVGMALMALSLLLFAI